MMPYSNMASPMYSGHQMMPYSNMSYPMYSGHQMMPSYSNMAYPMYSGHQMMPSYSNMAYPMYSGYQMMPSYSNMPYPMYSEHPMMPRDMEMIPHPILLVARQVAPNQIEIVYDQPTDLESATNVNNYWIRNNLDRPSDIATVARDDMMLLPTNSLTSNMAKITPVDNSRKRFIITFNMNATPGVQYTVLPCFVNLQGKTGFGGENWGPESRNTFTAQ